MVEGYGLQKDIWSYIGLGTLSPVVRRILTAKVMRYAHGCKSVTAQPIGVAVPYMFPCGVVGRGLKP